MESANDRFFRQSIPSLWPRFLAWVAIAFALNLIHARFEQRILTSLPDGSISEFYLRATSTVILMLSIGGLGGIVTCYYFALRQRRVHTALSEFGLAVRSVVAALLAFAAFILAIHINAGGFS